MKIAVLSCLYPYRGGISQFGACMVQELGKEHEVKAINFKRQYPSILFPGKTQYVSEGDGSVVIESERLLDSIGPCSWARTAKAIIEWKPDLVVICSWMSFFAPALGSVARRLRRKGIKVVGLLHNAIPHEPHFWDKPLTRYFLRACTGLVSLSGQVQSSVQSLGNFSCKQLFHPVYAQFGEALPRAEAEKALGLEEGKKNLLFFGLIRKYKGLDLLIKAFGSLSEEYQLIIAGEPYGSWSEYAALIESSPAKERIHCYTEFIPSEDVKKYFSAADLTVLPYRSASQSGVSAVSYNFGVPLVVTAVGSLEREIGRAGTGIVASRPEPEAIASAISSFFGTEGLQSRCKENIATELERLSWKNFCKALLEYNF